MLTFKTRWGFTFGLSKIRIRSRISWEWMAKVNPDSSKCSLLIQSRKCSFLIAQFRMENANCAGRNAHARYTFIGTSAQHFNELERSFVCDTRSRQKALPLGCRLRSSLLVMFSESQYLTSNYTSAIFYINIPVPWNTLTTFQFSAKPKRTLVISK